MKKFGVFTLTCFFLIAASWAYNPVPVFTARSNVETFVTRFYEECLDEDADPNDLNGWVSGLMNDSLTASDVAYAFLFGNKFTSQNITDEEFLFILNRVMLDRDPNHEDYQKRRS